MENKVRELWETMEQTNIQVKGFLKRGKKGVCVKRILICLKLSKTFCKNIYCTAPRWNPSEVKPKIAKYLYTS